MNKKLKTKQIALLEECNRKSIFTQFGDEKTRSYYDSIVVKNIIKKHLLNFSKKDIEDEYNKVYDQTLLSVNPKQKDLLIGILQKRLFRLKQYITMNFSGCKITKGGEVLLFNNDVSVDYSFVIINGDNVYPILIKNKASKVTKGGRTQSTAVHKNLELYLLQIAGEKIYPAKTVKATIIHLKDKLDTKQNVVDIMTYNTRSPLSVLSHDFTLRDRVDLDERIQNILKGTNDCEKKCDSCKYEAICNYNQTANIKKIVVPKSKTSNFNKFTPSQKSVIDCEEGNYRVIAGAGAGKTTCVANRICEMIKKGINPEDILLLTFTNKGVQEMKEKILFWLKENGIKISSKKLNIFTYNSFGQYLIDKEYRNLGYTHKPKLLDTSDALEVCEKLLWDYPEIQGLDYLDMYIKMQYHMGAAVQLYTWFMTLKDFDVLYPEEVAELLTVPEATSEQILEMYNEYKEFMIDNNFVDYKDQIKHLYSISEDDSKRLKYGYEYIIVDEFQDSDLEQIEILQNFAKYPYFKGIMVVGDDSQAIFSWRRAFSDFIIHFEDYFEDVKDLKLVENFRSTKDICEVANNLIAINETGIPKRLIGQNSGKMPELYSGDDFNIITAIKDEIASGVEKSDIAIIARNKSELMKIQDKLNQEKIPNIISVSEFLSENRAIKMFGKFIEFLKDNENDLYFVEYLKLSDSKNFEKKIKDKSNFKKYVEDKMMEFFMEWNVMTEDEQLKYIHKIIKKLAKKEIAFETLLNVWKEKKFNDLKEFYDFMYKLFKFNSEIMIEKCEDPMDAITLTTAHSSKGREWKTVYCSLDGFTRNYPKEVDYFGHKNDRSVEEERRVLFVALTRAKENLKMYAKNNHVVYQEIEECF